MIDTNEGVEMTCAATWPGVIASVTSTTTSLVMPTGTGRSGSGIELVHGVGIRDVPTTVDDEHLSGHIRREIADEEQEPARDVGGLRHPTRRHELRHRLPFFRA